MEQPQRPSPRPGATLGPPTVQLQSRSPRGVAPPIPSNSITSPSSGAHLASKGGSVVASAVEAARVLPSDTAKPGIKAGPWSRPGGAARPWRVLPPRQLR